jgi:hypothetical protein
MAGRFEQHTDAKDRFRFRLTAVSGQSTDALIEETV